MTRARKPTFAIRREDKSPWERRTPLVPEDVAALVDEHGLQVLVESSRERRIFSDEDYRQAGASIVDDITSAPVVFAVKEIPLEKLEAGKTYVFFAHVIKGQAHNMPLLRRLLDLGCTLIDYERIARPDANGKRQRLVYFSRQAGQAGMIDTLHLLGRRLAWEGYKTPLADVRPAHEYHDLAEAKTAIRDVGRRLAAGVETSDGPLTFGFTGRGRVTRGALDVFDLFPHEEVAPEDLPGLVERHIGTTDRLFKVRLEKRHLVDRRPGSPGGGFNEAEYRAHPERYRGGALARHLPYLTALVHGVFWKDAYPRFLTRGELTQLWRNGHDKLRIIGDITCDVDGSLETTIKATQPDDPAYLYEPLADRFRDGIEGDGVIVLAVDNLPCELPRDASVQFSQALRDFVAAVASADTSRPFEELDLPPEILRAVITHRGELTPNYRKLEKYLVEAVG